MIYLNITVVIFVFLIIFYLLGKVISSILNRKFSLEEGIIIGFSLFILLINLNFFYFNTNIFLILSILLPLIFLEKNFSFSETIQFFKIFRNISILITFSLIIIFIYGYQFIVFRGNFYDYFSYLSTASIISNNSFQSIKNIISQNNSDFFLDYSKFIFARPSSQILISIIHSYSPLNIFYSGYTFKLLCLILSQISAYSLFFYILKNKKKSLILSFGFIFSSFYFYIYEIDALSNLLAIPILLIVLKNTLSFIKNLKDNYLMDCFIYFFLFSILFVIYPEIASVFSIPIALFIITEIYREKLYKQKKILFFPLLFLPIFFVLIPLYSSTIDYLINNQIKGGLNSHVDYWGYFGAYILGKSNPIYDQNIVDQVKYLWDEKKGFIELLTFIHNKNYELNSKLYLMNVLPSLFGFFHLTTNISYGNANYIFIFVLSILNFTLILKIFKNIKNIFLLKKPIFIFLKILLIFYFFFSFYLLFNYQIWSLIKLFSFFGFIMFILISLNIKKNKLSINYVILTLLVIFPFYKYSEFNNGIGKLDSFPSIMKPQLKNNVNWEINYKNLVNCTKFENVLEDKMKFIYVSIILNEFNVKNNNDNVCKITFKNKNFKITKTNG